MKQRVRQLSAFAVALAVLVLLPAAASAQWVSGAGTQTTSDSVGIGVTPGVPLEIQKNGQLLSPNFYFNFRTGDNVTGRGFLLGYDSTIPTSIGVIAPSGVSGQLSFWNHNGSTWGERMRMDNLGNLVIGATSADAKLYVNGNAHFLGNATVEGNIAAKYQDVAEWVPASWQIPPGSVVILDDSQANHVRTSSTPYDTRVVGVVSEKPGLILGEPGADRVMVATAGRIRLRADATRSAIRVGDLLVTSDCEGVAMVSQPVDIGGIKIHRPGTIIGKALEPLPSGTGEILVLLTLQ